MPTRPPVPLRTVDDCVAEMTQYFDEHGCEPIPSDQTENHQMLLMVRYLLRNGFFENEYQSESLPPPASKEVVQNLPQKNVTQNDERCAICIKPNEDVNEVFLVLPCKHDFHKSCIIPWLEKTNSCPLCRFELKTDDEEYEEWKKFRERATGREHDIEELHNSMYG